MKDRNRLKEDVQRGGEPAGEEVVLWLRQEIALPWQPPPEFSFLRSSSGRVAIPRPRQVAAGDAHHVFWMPASLDAWGVISRASTARATEISRKCDRLAAAAWRNKLGV